MKKLLTSAAIFAVIASSASAGTLTEPVVEEIMEPAGSSSGGIIVPLLLLGVVAALIASKDDGGAKPVSVSDRRLKRNIERIGTAENGLPVYRYQYLWSSKVYEGVMAQDVAVHMPQALVKGLFGVIMVNYSMLGMQMKRVA